MDLRKIACDALESAGFEVSCPVAEDAAPTMPNAGGGTAPQPASAAQQMVFSLEAHDKRFHKGHYDGGTCKFREKMAAQAKALGIDDTVPGLVNPAKQEDVSAVEQSESFQNYKTARARQDEEFAKVRAEKGIREGIQKGMPGLTEEEEAFLEWQSKETNRLRDQYIQENMPKDEWDCLQDLKSIVDQGGDDAVNATKEVVGEEMNKYPEGSPEREGFEQVMESISEKSQPEEGQPAAETTEGAEASAAPAEQPAEENPKPAEEPSKPTEEAKQPPKGGWLSRLKAWAERSQQIKPDNSEQGRVIEALNAGLAGAAQQAEFDGLVSAIKSLSGDDDKTVEMMEQMAKDWREAAVLGEGAGDVRQGYLNSLRKHLEKMKEEAKADDSENGAYHLYASLKMKEKVQELQDAVAGLPNEEMLNASILTAREMLRDANTPTKFNSALNKFQKLQETVKAAALAEKERKEKEDAETKAKKEEEDTTKQLSESFSYLGGPTEDNIEKGEMSETEKEWQTEREKVWDRQNLPEGQGGITSAQAEEELQDIDDKYNGKDGFVPPSKIPPVDTNEGLDQYNLQGLLSKMTAGDKAQLLADTTKDVVQEVLDANKIPHNGISVEPGQQRTTVHIEVPPGVDPGAIRKKIQSFETQLGVHVGFENVDPTNPRSVVLTVPNSEQQFTSFQDAYTDPEALTKIKKARIPLIMGKDNKGKWIVEDLAGGMSPHALIGGATGSGKSIWAKALVMSLLMKSPKLVRPFIIDPKMVDFTAVTKDDEKGNKVSNIPGLGYADKDRIVPALKALNAEMQRRQRLLQKAGCAEIGTFNQKHPDNPLPYIPIIFDEMGQALSDNPEAEPLVRDMARLARAMGMHFIALNQTGDAKAIPTAISGQFGFRTSFKQDGKTKAQSLFNSNPNAVQAALALPGKGAGVMVDSKSDTPHTFQAPNVLESDFNNIVRRRMELDAGKGAKASAEPPAAPSPAPDNPSAPQTQTATAEKPQSETGAATAQPQEQQTVPQTEQTTETGQQAQRPEGQEGTASQSTQSTSQTQATSPAESPKVNSSIPAGVPDSLAKEIQTAQEEADKIDRKQDRAKWAAAKMKEANLREKANDYATAHKAVSDAEKNADDAYEKYQKDPTRENLSAWNKAEQQHNAAARAYNSLKREYEASQKQADTTTTTPTEQKAPSSPQSQTQGGTTDGNSQQSGQQAKQAAATKETTAPSTKSEGISHLMQATKAAYDEAKKAYQTSRSTEDFERMKQAAANMQRASSAGAKQAKAKTNLNAARMAADAAQAKWEKAIESGEGIDQATEELNRAQKALTDARSAYDEVEAAEKQGILEMKKGKSWAGGTYPEHAKLEEGQTIRQKRGGGRGDAFFKRVPVSTSAPLGYLRRDGENGKWKPIVPTAQQDAKYWGNRIDSLLGDSNSQVKYNGDNEFEVTLGGSSPDGAATDSATKDILDEIEEIEAAEKAAKKAAGKEGSDAGESSSSD